MADFKAIQAKFEADSTMSQKFLADPAGVLQEEGITLTPQQAFRLQQDVHAYMQAGGDVVANIQIGVSVGIRPPSISVTVRD